jgi:hypothetical protein
LSDEDAQTDIGHGLIARTVEAIGVGPAAEALDGFVIARLDGACAVGELAEGHEGFGLHSGNQRENRRALIHGLRGGPQCRGDEAYHAGLQRKDGSAELRGGEREAHLVALQRAHEEMLVVSGVDGEMSGGQHVALVRGLGIRDALAEQTRGVDRLIAAGMRVDAEARQHGAEETQAEGAAFAYDASVGAKLGQEVRRTVEGSELETQEIGDEQRDQPITLALGTVGVQRAAPRRRRHGNVVKT